MSSSLKDELYGKTARTAALLCYMCTMTVAGVAHFSIKSREERNKETSKFMTSNDDRIASFTSVKKRCIVHLFLSLHINYGLV